MNLYRHILKKILMGGAIALSIVSVCQDAGAFSGVPPTTQCIVADDFGNLVREKFTVKAIGEGDLEGLVHKKGASDGWLETGVDVIEGEPLQIKVGNGEVELCANGTVIGNVSPDSTEPEWQATGVYFEKGSKYKIEVTGRYSMWGGLGEDVVAVKCSDLSLFDKYNDDDCWARKGRGLFAYIGAEPPASDWYKNDTQGSGKNPEFFELYDYKKNKSGFDGDFNNLNLEDGERVQLYLRYRDGPRVRDTRNGSSANWGDSQAYDNNRGRYTVKVLKKGCKGEKGEYLVAFFGDKAPGSYGSGNFIDMGKYAGDPYNGLFNSVAPGGGGKLWLKIIDDSSDGLGDGDYTPYSIITKKGSNHGGYIVNVITRKAPSEGLANIINGVIGGVRNFLLGDKVVGADGVSRYNGGVTKDAYQGLTGNFNFILAIRAAMGLSIVFFAFTYMAGLSNITQKEMLSLVIKIGIVATLLGENSWEFFYNYLFTFFIEGTDNLIQIMSGQFLDAASGYLVDESGRETIYSATSEGAAHSAFAFMNRTISMIFTTETASKISAIITTSFSGFLMGLLLIVGVIMFLFGVIKAVTIYLIAIIMVSVLLFMAPLFMAFLLFERTRPVFDKWLKQLMNFSLQPILMFTVLAIFNVFILSTLYSLLSFNVCWKCLWMIDLPLSEALAWMEGAGASALDWVGIIDKGDGPGNGILGNFDRFCLLYGYQPWGLDHEQELATKLSKAPVTLFLIFIFLIFTSVMMKFIDWARALASSLTGGVSSVNLGGAFKAATNEVANIPGAVGGGLLGVGDLVSGDRATKLANKVRQGIKNAPANIARGAAGLGAGAVKGVVGGTVKKLGGAAYKKATGGYAMDRAKVEEARVVSGLTPEYKKFYNMAADAMRKDRELMTASEKSEYNKNEKEYGKKMNRFFNKSSNAEIENHFKKKVYDMVRRGKRGDLDAKSLKDGRDGMKKSDERYKNKVQRDKLDGIKPSSNDSMYEGLDKNGFGSLFGDDDDDDE